MGDPRDRARPRPPGADRVGVRARPTGTSACAATSTRANRTDCRAPTWPASTRSRPLPYAEAGYGYPEAGQTVVNVTNGKIIRLLVDDEPFDVRYGQLRSHERVLDLRAGRAAPRASSGSRRPAAGASRARPGWCRSPSARSPRSATRSSRSTARPGGGPVRAGRQRTAARRRGRPARRGRARGAAAVGVLRRHRLARRTGPPHRASGLRIAAAMDHVVEGPDGPSRTTRGLRGRRPADRHRRRSSPGEPLRIVKFVAYGWSARALDAGAARPGRGGAGRGHAHRLGGPARARSAPTSTPSGSAPTSRSRATPSSSRRPASRCSTCSRPGARAEQRAIAAKGLTGPGYDGHTFWDTETFVLPVLTYTLPAGGGRRAALAALDARPGARAGRAARPDGRGVPVADDPRRGVLGLLAGRARPPFTSTPTSPTPSCATWPRPTTRSSSATSALELLVETARLWRSLGHHDPAGRFRIDGVTGPDEYSAIADNNVYTNLMAQRNLRAAADAPSATRSARRRSASTTRRPPAGATRPRRC